MGKNERNIRLSCSQTRAKTMQTIAEVVANKRSKQMASTAKPERRQ